ncbi:mechanosensitive ion channel family protein [Glycomyces xiaoerkulensis]|uniref:mechanosensitive ion channel family protein n=1 Tax=Glycomyces xiaoerkulensis TaxID=2038139 RepID=UPI000C2609F3|nr:mechanosensitive ion channel domain-containing protein [Glycomyces xiaoerkulensis]
MELLAATGDSPCETGINSCSLLWGLTESQDFALDGGAFLDRLFHVLLILVVALIVRWVGNRFISRLVKQVTSTKRPQAIGEMSGLNGLLGPGNNRREELVGDRSRARSETLTGVLQHVNGVVVMTVAFMLILGAFGVNLAPILASAGIVGVALGFGAQALVQDYLAGIFILAEDQYGVGDVVDVGEVIGTIVDMGLRVTTVRALDGSLWYVRNGQILRVGNSSQSWANVILDTPLPPTADVDRSAEVIMAAIREFAQDEEWSQVVLDEPEYQGVAKMTIDEMTLRTAIRTSGDMQWAAGRELRRRISEALREAGISDDMRASRVYVPRSMAGQAKQ